MFEQKTTFSKVIKRTTGMNRKVRKLADNCLKNCV